MSLRTVVVGHRHPARSMLVAGAALTLLAGAASAQVGEPIDVFVGGNGQTIVLAGNNCDGYTAQAAGGVTLIVRATPSGPFLGTLKRLVHVTETIPECPVFVVPSPPPGTYWVTMVYGLVDGQLAPGATWKPVVVNSTGCTSAPPVPVPSPGHPLINGNHVALNFDTPVGCPGDIMLIDVSTQPWLPPATTYPLPTAGFETTAPSGTYYVRARSRNAFGPSNPSMVMPVTLPGGCTAKPQGPINPTATVAGPYVTLGWSQTLAGTTFYVLTLKDVSTGRVLLNHVIPAATSFTTPPLQPGNYRVGVTGGNACGTTSPITGDVFFTVP